jgi:ribosomal protein S12 methylthiotransferase accessory factor
MVPGLFRYEGEGRGGDVIAERIGESSRASLGALAELISPRTGIIRSLSRVSRGTEEPSPPVVCQSLVSQFDYRTASTKDRLAAGKGETEQEAMLGAIGEALERYCAYQENPEAVFRATAADLGRAAIPPPDFVLYSDRQYALPGFKYAKPDMQTPIGWTRAVELPEGSEAFVPASLVYLYFNTEGPDGYFCPPTSNGLAAGPSLDSAVLSGLYELIERDAFLITWMNRLAVPRVDYSSMPGIAARIRSHYARFGIEALVYDVTTDIGVPVMMAMAVDRSGGGPAVVVGLGCHLNPAVALKKALMEVCQVRPSQSIKFAKSSPAETLNAYSDVKTLEDHAGFAAIPGNLHEFDFLWNSSRSKQIEEMSDGSAGEEKADLAHCVRLLRAAECRVAYVELTTPDVAPYGVHVVRAIATGMQPIHFGTGEERLGGRRVFETAAKLGYMTGIRTEADLNPCPHPLP